MTSGWWVIKVGVPRGELGGGQRASVQRLQGEGERELEVKAEKKEQARLQRILAKCAPVKTREGMEQGKYE